MKRLLLLALCFTISFNVSLLQAQEQTTLYYFDEIIDDDILLGGGILNVSPNGKYAVGYDDIFMETGYVWDATSKKLAMIDTGAGESVLVNDVDDNGTILGSFQNEDGIYSPGYLKDGEWHSLPVPEDIKESRRKDSDYAPIAQAFSADGKIIGGTIYYNEGKFRPVLWIDGKLQEFPDLQLEGQGFYLYDISNDGSIIAGWTESSMGDRIAAIIVNGELKKLYEPDMENEDRFFLECIASHVDAKGNVTGYITDDDAILHGFIYNEKDGLKYISEGPIGCSLNDNCVFGSISVWGDASIIKDGEESTLKEFLKLDTDKFISTVTACSADAKILAGSGICANDMGAFSVPYVIELSEESRGEITSIQQQNVDKNSVSLSSGGQLFITGSYTGVCVYSTTGSCVTKDNQQGHIINLSQLPSGMYIVKVVNGNQSQSFKVFKR